MTQEEKKKYLNIVKGTIGYHESANKTEFIKGAEVAIGRIAELYEKDIETFRKSILHRDKRIIELHSDLKTISKIINSYQP